MFYMPAAILTSYGVRVPSGRFIKVRVGALAGLGLVDLPVYLIVAQQLLVGGKAVDPAVVHDDDAVAVLDTGDPLGDDQTCRIRDLLLEGPADLRIGRGVDRARAVIQDQDLRFFEQCARDAQALLLTAGDVGAALLDIGVISLGHLLDEFVGTGQAAGPPALLVSRVLIAPA